MPPLPVGQHLIRGIGLQAQRVLTGHADEPVHTARFQHDNRRLWVAQDVQLDLVEIGLAGCQYAGLRCTVRWSPGTQSWNAERASADEMADRPRSGRVV